MPHQLIGSATQTPGMGLLAAPRNTGPSTLPPDRSFSGELDRSLREADRVAERAPSASARTPGSNEPATVARDRRNAEELPRERDRGHEDAIKSRGEARHEGPEGTATPSSPPATTGPAAPATTEHVTSDAGEQTVIVTPSHIAAGAPGTVGGSNRDAEESGIESVFGDRSTTDPASTTGGEPATIEGTDESANLAVVAAVLAALHRSTGAAQTGGSDKADTADVLAVPGDRKTTPALVPFESHKLQSFTPPAPRAATNALASLGGRDAESASGAASGNAARAPRHAAVVAPVAPTAVPAAALEISGDPQTSPASVNLAPALAEETLGAVAAPASGQPSHRASAGIQLPVYTPAGQRVWAEEVGSRITWMVGQRESSAELVLTPASLGKLSVSIHISGEQTTAQFVAATVAAREALEQAMPRLREVLQQAGISLGQANVSTSGEQHPHDNSGGHGSSRGRGRGQVVNATALTAVSQRWARSGDGVIDTFA